MAGTGDPPAGADLMWRKVMAGKPLSVLALLCLAGGIVTLVYFVYLIRSAGNSADWPSTTGKLIKCRVAKHRSSSVGGRYGYGSRNDTVSYYLEVEYDYEVAGVPRRGSRFYFGPGTGDRDYWEEKAKKYCAERSVDVYYNPGDPGESSLETEGGEENYIFILMGLGFMGYGIYLFTKVFQKQTP